MSREYTDFQRRALELLLNQYEGSRTYQGENQRTQRFRIAPESVFPDYSCDYADVDQISRFEDEMEELRKDGLLEITWKNGTAARLTAIPGQWKTYYECLHREERRQLQNRQIELYESFSGVHPLLERFCREQIERLRQNRKAACEAEEAGNILRLCQFILSGRQDILERELSMEVLGDSKLWEQKYRSKVCKILKQYGDYGELLMGMSDGTDQEDRRETERILLAEHGVYSNPSYVYFKGNARFSFDSGQSLEISQGMPMAFSSETLKRLRSVEIQDGTVMTVENLTSFNRMERDHTFFIFLSGYHNSVKQTLIRRLYEENPGRRWLHFGDIDPDGFYIIEHLKRGTGIDFQPVYMDVSTIKAYQKYTKELTEHDRRKAERLLADGAYKDVMEYLLRTGRKLEQEIISYYENRNRK